jgi:hypothetical protein
MMMRRRWVRGQNWCPFCPWWFTGTMLLKGYVKWSQSSFGHCQSFVLLIPFPPMLSRTYSSLQFQGYYLIVSLPMKLHIGVGRGGWWHLFYGATDHAIMWKSIEPRLLRRHYTTCHTKANQEALPLFYCSRWDSQSDIFWHCPGQ